MILAGHTALFMQSKNLEVDPLSMSDITDYFLKKYNATSKDILGMEKNIRNACQEENESATIFDFLLWYIKVWKLTCQEHFEKIKKS